MKLLKSSAYNKNLPCTNLSIICCLRILPSWSSWIASNNSWRQAENWFWIWKTFIRITQTSNRISFDTSIKKVKAGNRDISNISHDFFVVNSTLMNVYKYNLNFTSLQSGIWFIGFLKIYEGWNLSNGTFPIEIANYIYFY